MCILEAATKSMSTGASYITSGAQTVVKTVISGPLFLNRKFVELTNSVLPASLAKFTQEAVYSMPFAVASVMLPGNVVLAAMLTYALASIVIGTPHESIQNTFWIGIRNGYAYTALRNIVDFAQHAQTPINGAVTNICLTWLSNQMVVTPDADEVSQADELSASDELAAAQ